MLTVYTGNEDVPMVMFVYDRITSDNASYGKKFLLQIPSSDAPTVSGKTVSTENGNGKLVLTCLSNNATIEKVGGRTYGSDGKYVAESSKNYWINGKQNTTTNNYDVGSWGRVEITVDSTKTSSLLNSLYVTDKGNTTYYETKPITNISTGNFTTSNADDLEGCVFNNSIAAIFVKRNIIDSTKYINGTVSFTTAGEGSMSYYVDGLSGAGKWTVSVNGSVIGTETAIGGLLTFTAPAGNVTLTYQAA
jgi:hypothetical protein